MKIIVKIILLWPLYFLIGILPRNKKIWCFGSYRNKFNDNSKYAYLKCSLKYPEIKCYWVTDDIKLIEELSENGLYVVKRRSLKGLYIMCRAYVYFVSSYATDIFFWTSKGCYFVNLWHGLPLKKIEYDIDNGPLYEKYNGMNVFKNTLYKIKEPECFKKPDLMFAPNEFWVNLLSKAFDVENNKFIRCGSPRTDVFFENNINKNLHLNCRLNSILHLDENKARNILLMPTFRDSCVDYFEAAKLDFEVFNEFLINNDCQLYVKLHPSDHSSISIDTKLYRNVHIINEDVDDIYPYLKSFDLLITDYSSIYLDYILLNKEVIFFCFDLDDYIKKSRNLYFNYEEFTPGYKADSFGLLMDRVEDFITRGVCYDKKSFLDKYFSGNKNYDDSDAIYDHVRNLIQ